MEGASLSLLGPFRLTAGTEIAIPSKKAQALIGYLAATPGRGHRRDKLAGLLWGDRGEEQARHSLRQTLSSVRKALGAGGSGFFHISGDTIALNADAVAVDIARFEALAAEGTVAALSEAMTLYQGDLLDGLNLKEPAFEDWLFPERNRLRALALDSLQALLDLRIAEDAHEPAVSVAQRLLALDPLQETVHRKLMRLYADQGRKDAALRQYRTCADVLRRELGVAPEPATRALADEIARHREAREEMAGAAVRHVAPAPAPSVCCAGTDPGEPHEPERKHVTVLFADIEGSTEIIAEMDPEDALEHLDPAIQAMIDAVHRYDGTVSNVQGDGVVALFGAPIAHEDHAVRACYAALAMREAIAAPSDTGLAIRVGIHSGEVVVRSVANGNSRHYDAVGPVMHLASRIEQEMPPDTIGLTIDTCRGAEGFIDIETLGTIDLKGLERPVDVYALVGSSAARSRWEARATRELTRFVGRDEELAKMARALDRAADGHGEVIAIVGEPGMGKSRLVHEFINSALTRDWTVLETGAAAHSQQASYLPVSDLLRSWFEVAERDTQAEIAQKVREGLTRLDGTLMPALPALLSLLDLPVQDAAWWDLNPPQRRRLTLDAIKSLIVRRSQERPLILVFEDLHWVDAETEAVLGGLVDALAAARIVLLVTYRPEYQHDWAGKSYFRLIRADPLQAETAKELLRSLLGDDPALDLLRPKIIEATGGNPLFLEEIVKALVETGVLEGKAGRYRQVSPVGDFEMPSTIQALLAARIDRLPAERKRLLQSAAAVGMEFPLPLLRGIVDLDDDALMSELDALQAAELLYQTQLLPEPSYTFKHALIRDVAYGGLLHERRRELHARIVAAIERMSGDRLSERVEALAYHAYHGQLWEQALEYARQAGARAMGRSAYHEAAAAYEQMLVAHGHLPETPEEIRRGIDIRFEYRSPNLPLGEHDKVFRRASEAEQMAAAIGDDVRRGTAMAYLQICHWMKSDYATMLDYGHRGLALCEKTGDFGLGLLTNACIGFAYLALGEFEKTIEHGRRVFESVSGDDCHRNFGLASLPSVASRCTASWAQAELGDFEAGARWSAEAVEIANASKQGFSRAFAYFAAGIVETRRGDARAAIPLLENSLKLCESGYARAMLTWVAPTLGLAYLLQGDTAAAMPHLERGMAPEVRRYGWPLAMPVRHLALGRLRAGKVEEAQSLAEQSLAENREHGERAQEAWSLRLSGLVAAAQAPDQVDTAVGYFRQGRSLAESLGLRPLIGHCRLELGDLYARIGRSEDARTELSAAADLYRSLEARYWLSRAESSLAGLG